MSPAITLESQAFWAPPTQNRPLRCSKTSLSQKATQTTCTQRWNVDEAITISSDTDSDDESENMNDDGNEQVHDICSSAARQSRATSVLSSNPSTLDTLGMQVAVPSNTSAPSQSSEELRPASTAVCSTEGWEQPMQTTRSVSEPTGTCSTKSSPTDRAASDPLEQYIQSVSNEHRQPRHFSTAVPVCEHHDAEIAGTDYPIDPLLKDYELDLREVSTNEAPGTTQAALFDDMLQSEDQIAFEGPRSPMSVPAAVHPSTIPASQLSFSGLSSPTTSPLVTDMDSPKDVAAFNEWPLKDVVLKRTILDGRATFQLQFEWPIYTMHTAEVGKLHKKKSRRTSRTTSSTASQGSHASRRRVKFSSEEDELLRRLKDDDLPWSEIYRRFTATYPGRSRGALQVRYCTKLNCR